MSSLEPARHALYAELEQVLGAKNAETLMTHLPQHASDSVATKNANSHLNTRFDRMEDSMATMHRNLLTVSFGTLTVMTAIFSFIPWG